MKQQASHACADCGARKVFWSVRLEPMKLSSSLPRVAVPAHTAHGSGSWTTQPSTAGAPT